MTTHQARYRNPTSTRSRHHEPSRGRTKPTLRTSSSGSDSSHGPPHTPPPYGYHAGCTNRPAQPYTHFSSLPHPSRRKASGQHERNVRIFCPTTPRSSFYASRQARCTHSTRPAIRTHHSPPPSRTGSLTSIAQTITPSLTNTQTSLPARAARRRPPPHPRPHAAGCTGRRRQEGPGSRCQSPHWRSPKCRQHPSRRPTRTSFASSHGPHQGPIHHRTTARNSRQQTAPIAAAHALPAKAKCTPRLRYVAHQIARSKAATGPGPSGWRNSHLACTYAHPGGPHALLAWATTWAQGDVPPPGPQPSGQAH